MYLCNDGFKPAFRHRSTASGPPTHSTTRCVTAITACTPVTPATIAATSRTTGPSPANFATGPPKNPNPKAAPVLNAICAADIGNPHP
jgi:hypothetical protein